MLRSHRRRVRVVGHVKQGETLQFGERLAGEEVDGEQGEKPDA